MLHRLDVQLHLLAGLHRRRGQGQVRSLQRVGNIVHEDGAAVHGLLAPAGSQTIGYAGFLFAGDGIGRGDLAGPGFFLLLLGVPHFAVQHGAVSLGSGEGQHHVRTQGNFGLVRRQRGHVLRGRGDGEALFRRAGLIAGGFRQDHDAVFAGGQLRGFDLIGLGRLGGILKNRLVGGVVHAHGIARRIVRRAHGEADAVLLFNRVGHSHRGLGQLALGGGDGHGDFLRQGAGTEDGFQPIGVAARGVLIEGPGAYGLAVLVQGRAVRPGSVDRQGVIHARLHRRGRGRQLHDLRAEDSFSCAIRIPIAFGGHHKAILAPLHVRSFNAVRLTIRGEIRRSTFQYGLSGNIEYIKQI